MLYLIYGEDTYRSKEKVNEIKNSFIKNYDPQKLNVDHINLEEKNLKLKDIISLLNAPPFLSSKRLIILENFLTKKFTDKEKEQLINLIDNLANYNNEIILFEYSKNLDKRQKFIKKILEIAEISEFQLLEKFALNKWIKNYVKNANSSISDEAIKQLAANIGPNLWQLKNELNKLIAYKHNERINLEDVHKISKGQYQDYIFQLIDAISSKNIKEAYNLLDYQLKRGQDIFLIWNLLLRQFRLLITIKDLLNRNYTKPDINNLIKEHPYVINQIIKLSKNFTFQRLQKIYNYLYKWEKQLKSYEHLPEQFLIELLVLAI